MYSARRGPRHAALRDQRVDEDGRALGRVGAVGEALVSVLGELMAARCRSSPPPAAAPSAPSRSSCATAACTPGDGGGAAGSVFCAAAAGRARAPGARRLGRRRGGRRRRRGGGAAFGGGVSWRRAFQTHPRREGQGPDRRRDEAGPAAGNGASAYLQPPTSVMVRVVDVLHRQLHRAATSRPVCRRRCTATPRRRCSRWYRASCRGRSRAVPSVSCA